MTSPDRDIDRPGQVDMGQDTGQLCFSNCEKNGHFFNYQYKRSSVLCTSVQRSVQLGIYTDRA